MAKPISRTRQRRPDVPPRRQTTAAILSALALWFSAATPAQAQAPDASPDATGHPAPFVWVDAKGEGRNVSVYFRRELELEAPPARALLNVFADSRYHLKVNGTFVAFGPARFYPAHPQYDSHDLTPFLRQGRNVIAVHALSNGMNTFQIPEHVGGFVAWGEVATAEGVTLSLATPGEWRCRRATGYDETAPKMSFATGAIEVYDARRDGAAWDAPETDPAQWTTPVVLEDQEAWGPLAPRSIPQLTQREVVPKVLLGIHSLSHDEFLYSFRVKTPDRTMAEFGTPHRLFAYTYINSPRSQTVDVGLWWGEHYLNGVGPLEKQPPVAERPNRNDVTLELRQGWNFFFVKYDVAWAAWDFHMAVPRSALLELSASRTFDSEHVFMTAGPFAPEEEQRVLALGLPLAGPEQLPDLSEGWVGWRRDQTAGNPAWEMAWRPFDEARPSSPWQVSDLVADDRSGTAFVFDMGSKQLGRIFVDFDAPRGTVVDAGFSERLDSGKPWILRRAGLYTAARHVARGGRGRLETFNPYGLRYVQVNVTGNASPVRLNRVGVLRQVYPFDKVGRFECSDPMLNAIWELGWRTLQVCAEDAYTDTPYRERGLYAGDTLPELAITLAGSGDTRLLRRSLELFRDMYAPLLSPEGGRPAAEADLADYPLITLELLSWYVDRSGDLELAEELYPGYRRLVDAALELRDEFGLFRHPRPFIEWTAIDTEGTTLAAMQALLARSCESMAHIASKLGQYRDATRYRSLSEEVVATLHESFWDPDAGAFGDGFKGDEPIDSFFPISSAYPSLFGLTTEEQEGRLRGFFAQALSDIGDRARQRRVTPYGGFYVLGALYRHGHADLAEEFMRRHWSPMILQDDDTAWENFSLDGDQGTSSHAWSGGPTYYLTTQVLGVDLGFPVRSNPSELVIAPQAHSVSWARGVVPHPAGPVSVAWREDGERLFVDCAVPEGVSWTVWPRGRLAAKELWVNGERASGSR